MTTIYHRPHPNTTVEPRFLAALQREFPEATISKGRYVVDTRYLDCLVDKNELVAQLRANSLLPSKCCDNFITILETLPPKLKVATTVSDISFDFVIERDGQFFHWELHEKQHRSLKGGLRRGRTFNVYSPSNEPKSVPRGLQRLVRDTWRAKYVEPITIVWADWFLSEELRYRPALLEGFNEFHTEGSFSFGQFCRYAL